MALGNRLPTIRSALMAAEAQQRRPSPEELAIMAANAEMVRRAKELATAPSTPRVPDQPGPLGARLADQEALQRRIDEESAVLEMRMRRGQDVDASEIDRLSGFVDPSVRGPAPPSQTIEPERLMVPYVPGTASASPLGTAKGRDIVQSGRNLI